ncbi:hypothetical protein Tco_0174870, partial [Tanacetum coccineum]
TRLQFGTTNDLKIDLQKVETASGLLVTPSGSLSDVVWKRVDAVWISRQM